MLEIHYKITFLSDWHIGSGLAGGPEADAIVLKDKDSLPYIPGKTIKGLLRDALEDIQEATGHKIIVEQIFGKKDSGTRSVINFSNAELSPKEKLEITANGLSDFLYRNIASTAIDANGVAQKQALRVMEVCIPLKLTGTIANIETPEIKDKLLQTLKWVRHLGVNRNRGLGRCKFIEILTPEEND
ncbi:RAMP superfamily CRISPR-associated protein [Emticicia sp. BO119]|uniref:RAMP superfamily CRISPR-associated protein n=1 Tax=Emticicia sp. BO119 TaxID=2757768 RepID=UPI0015F10115|nr:RAMP superfamily CRISPR-associated protein [Emticicia sp. BO119]MBA4848971.1 CRISPR-associated protein [Emticicia sp. BO119]